MLGSLSVVSTELSPRGLASLSFHPTCLNAHFSLMPLLSSIPFLLHFFILIIWDLPLWTACRVSIWKRETFLSSHLSKQRGNFHSLPKEAKRIFLTSFGFAFSQTSVEQKRLPGQVNLEKGTEFVCSDISVLTFIYCPQRGYELVFTGCRVGNIPGLNYKFNSKNLPGVIHTGL